MTALSLKINVKLDVHASFSFYFNHNLHAMQVGCAAEVTMATVYVRRKPLQ